MLVLGRGSGFERGIDAVTDVVVSTDSARYDVNDERWAAQTRDLLDELRREVPGYRVESTVAPGTKGTADSVILALGSAGTLSAAAACFKAWLARDRTRRVVLSWERDGRQERIVIEGDAVDLQSIHQLGAAIGRLLPGSVTDGADPAE
ncbi:hypothetical protein [Actinoplanes sp. NPDC049265]|uniref:effector-associated constant component EACC1 n=1 Tax=Actinoplanes sp. NPDC049265 TaxID=3363902 RepID=UPI003721097B